MTNEIQRTDEGRESSLPVPFDLEILKLRMAYFGYTAVPSAILLDIMTQGQIADSLAVAAMLGGAACYWGPHLHKVIGPGMHAAGQVWDYLNRNNSGKARHHLMDKHWWLYGEVSTPYAETNEDQGDDENMDKVATPVAKKPTHVHLADNLTIPINDIASKAIFIAGIRRSGKTTLGTRLAEELSQHYIPMFIPDLEGDWLSATKFFPMGKIAAHPDAEEQYEDVGVEFEPTTVENADVVGFNILDEGMQLVLDMASYPSVDEACQVVINVIKGLFEWTNQNPKKRVPCQVFLDEAQRFLPQTLSDSIIQSKQILQDLLKAYMDITAVGGKRGLAPVILSQRFAQTNNKIIAQSEIFFLLRQTMDNDLARCMEYVKKTTATPERIAALRKGEGVYIAATGEQLVTRFLQRQSSGDRSHTPTAEAAQRYAQERQPKEQKESPVRDSKPGLPASNNRANLSVVPPQTGTPEDVPEMDVNTPAERAGLVPEVFQPKDDDLLLSGLQIDLLIVHYKHCNNIKKSLEQMKIGNRYSRHASFILEQRGLKKRGA
jgi:hypothetical protein